MNNPAYYRARIVTFYHFISKSDDEKVRFWRNGVIPEDDKESFFKMVKDKLNNNSYDSGKLTLTEIMTFNTWFEMHQDKVAGIEILTTSIAFPVTIKGNVDNVINTIKKSISLDQVHTDNYDKAKRIRIAKAKAIAKIKLLKL